MKKAHRAGSRGHLAQAATCPLLVELYKQCLILSIIMSENTHIILPTGEANPDLGTQRF